MKPFAALLGLLTAVNVALADVNYSIARDQAHRAGNGGNPQPPPAAPNQPQPPPADPVLQAALRNIASLRADIAALINTAGEKPDPAIKPSLLNDLTAAAQGTKPPSASVQKLAGHLMTALIHKKIPAPQQLKLARSLHAACNGGHLSPAQQQTLLDDVNLILTDAGTLAGDTDYVANDIRQIATETK